jgi:hypothetical protein
VQPSTPLGPDQVNVSLLLWSVYKKRDERLRQEKLEELRRQAEEREIKKQENLKREAEERSKRQAELQERQRQLEAQRTALRQKEEERLLKVAEKWAPLTRKAKGTSRFQLQIMKLQTSIPVEVKDWRSQITWQYREGKAIRIDPLLPTPEKDSDLQSVRTAIWTKKMLGFKDEDELAQSKHEERASLKWAIRPELLSFEALWDEHVYHMYRRTQRAQEVESSQELPRSASWEQEDFETWRWKDKYRRHDISTDVFQMMNKRYKEMKKKAQKFERIVNRWTRLVRTKSQFQV